MRGDDNNGGQYSHEELMRLGRLRQQRCQDCGMPFHWHHNWGCEDPETEEHVYCGGWKKKSGVKI
jgi:hypothetical protein